MPFSGFDQRGMFRSVADHSRGSGGSKTMAELTEMLIRDAAEKYHAEHGQYLPPILVSL